MILWARTRISGCRDRVVRAERVLKHRHDVSPADVARCVGERRRSLDREGLNRSPAPSWQSRGPQRIHNAHGHGCPVACGLPVVLNRRQVV